MHLFHHPNCSTCKKARKFLDQMKVSYELIDLRENAPTPAQLHQMLANYQDNVKRLFNTSGMQYRELDMKNRLPKMTTSESIALLSSNGLLVKRPFLLSESTEPSVALVGFSEAEWSETLNAQ